MLNSQPVYVSCLQRVVQRVPAETASMSAAERRAATQKRYREKQVRNTRNWVVLYVIFAHDLPCSRLLLDMLSLCRHLKPKHYRKHLLRKQLHWW
jgi:hypothetical protein